jgi:hypothetical protein
MLAMMSDILFGPQAVELLQENLRQEKEALKKVESISRRLVKEASNGSSRTRSSTSRVTARA